MNIALVVYRLRCFAPLMVRPLGSHGGLIVSVELEGLDETALERLAASLAARLEPGDVVVLAGEVGSGKTTFVRAAAALLASKGG